MATDITHLNFDDGADIQVVTIDQHIHHPTALDIQTHGVLIINTENSVTTKLFIPWHFIQSINQVL